MDQLETLQEPKVNATEVGQIDLLMAIPAPVGSEVLTPAIEKLFGACKILSAPCRIVLALPADTPNDVPALLPSAAANGASTAPLPYVNYTLPPAVPSAISWLPNAAAYREISRLASKLGARACTVLGTDQGFNRPSLTADKLTLLVDPGTEGGFDLVMPLYTTQAFDDLVNKSILYPLTRTLYGHRVQNPLGNEVQVSSRMFLALSASPLRDSNQQQARLPWLATMAANQNLKICQVQLGAPRPSTSDGIELSAAISQLVGPLFLDMEDNAAFWQRVRGSHDVPTFGAASASTDTADTVDVSHMLDAFRLGERNLRDIWALVLPPVTLLELQKLSRLPAEQFQMPDALWARIVYDFALAHRMRNINRAHLFGALTPLYLGWVASYAVAINQKGIASAPQQLEQLARTYESEKPYLLSRWRWPDRIHLNAY